MSVSDQNNGALRFATLLYEVDSSLSVQDRTTLADFYRSVQTTSFVAIVLGATLCGVGVSALCSKVLPPTLANKPAFKYGMVALTGAVAYKLLKRPAELAVFDYKLPDLKAKTLNGYKAASIYRGENLLYQYEYYKLTATDPSKRIQDPRTLGDGKFDNFVNNLRGQLGDGKQR